MSVAGDAKKNRLFWLGVVAFIALTIVSAIDMGTLLGQEQNVDALAMTSVVIIGLAIVVLLLILLIIFYKVVGIEDKTQALGLPVGSVRALIAFCLVFMFVGLGIYLYHGVNEPAIGKTAKNVRKEDIEALKTKFSAVVPEPIKAPDPVLPPPNETEEARRKREAANADAALPHFNVTYFPDRSKEADDFAKLIFTQLATVFVTVIGFYFGSSTAAAGVGAGVAATGGPPNKGDGNAGPGLGPIINEAKVLAAEAAANLKRIYGVVTSLNAAKPSDPSKVTAAEKTQTDCQQAVDAINAQLVSLTAAANKFGLGTADENKAAADAVTDARNKIKELAAKVNNAADQLDPPKAPSSPTTAPIATTPAPKPGASLSAVNVPAAHCEATALASAADADLKSIRTFVDSIKSANPVPDAAKVDSAQQALKESQVAVASIQDQMAILIPAAVKFGTASTDAENAAFADTVMKCLSAIKPLAAQVKAAAQGTR